MKHAGLLLTRKSDRVIWMDALIAPLFVTAIGLSWLVMLFRLFVGWHGTGWAQVLLTGVSVLALGMAIISVALMMFVSFSSEGDSRG